MKMKEKPLYIFQKKADKKQNRIIIPQPFITKYGSNLQMEVYKDYIKLIPTGKGGE